MATGPNRPDDGEKIVSLREARARQEAQARAAKSQSDGRTPERKMPVLLIFLGLLAIVVALRFSLG